MGDGLDRCWNQIGVGGDASCARLAAVGHCRNCDEYSSAGRSLFDREPSGPVREDWSRLLAEPKATAATGTESFIVFQVRDEYLALRTVLLEHVTDARPVHSVPPRSNPVFTGLVNVDGELLPCFSTAAALQLQDANAAPTTGRILVLRHDAVRLACVVDRVIGVVRLCPGDLETPPVTLARYSHALTRAVFAVKGKRAGLLDTDKFIDRLMKSVAL